MFYLRKLTQREIMEAQTLATQETTLQKALEQDLTPPQLFKRNFVYYLNQSYKANVYRQTKD